MKSHLQSYPCPLQINSFWNLGFLLGITIILQIITGIFLGLHYTSDLNSAYSSIFFFIREIFYGWCLRYLHSSGASFVFLFLFLHLGRAISYGSYFYNPNSVSLEWFLFSHRFLSLSLYFSRHTSFMLDFIFFFSRNYFCIHNPLIRLSLWDHQLFSITIMLLTDLQLANNYLL